MLFYLLRTGIASSGIALFKQTVLFPLDIMFSKDLIKEQIVEIRLSSFQTLRMCDISGFGLHHGVTHGCELQGYWIPENTVVIPFIHSVMMEPQIWTDPEKFRPERFLDDRNKLIVKEEFIPMGIGKLLVCRSSEKLGRS